MKIREEVLAVVSRMEPDGNVLKITDGQLDRKLYVNVNNVLEAMGGKWNRKLKGHVFDADPTPLLDSVLLVGEIIVPKDFGFFPTPPSLARRTIERAEIKTGNRILEPSAGDGALLREMPGDTCRTAIEINPDFADRLRLHQMAEVHCVDFLKCNGELGMFDRIVMNPPFGKQADIDHVLHAWKFLKPGGRLVSIMSAGVEFRENRKTVSFRDFLADANHANVITNPAGSFKPSGTDVSTVTVIIDKAEA